MTDVAAGELEHVLLTRRTVATRTILGQQALLAAKVAIECRKSGLNRDAADALEFGALVAQALAEVDAAERGCGHENGDCTCPCHLTP